MQSSVSGAEDLSLDALWEPLLLPFPLYNTIILKNDTNCAKP